jgi:hypothetical protein
MPVGEIAKTAGSLIEAMKSHPLALGLVIMNVGLMVIVWFEMSQVFSQQKEINALLSKCVDPEILRGLGLIK